MRLYILLDWLIFNGTSKTNLAMLAFLYCKELMKNSWAHLLILLWFP